MTERSLVLLAMSIIPTNPLKRQRTTTPWQMYASDQYARFPVLSTAPVGPSEGWLYFDDGTNTANGNAGLRKYDGTAWVDVGGIENGVLTVTSLVTGNVNYDVLSSAVSPPAAGMVYYDDGTNTASGNPGLRAYDGSAWQDVSLQTANGELTSLDMLAATSGTFNVDSASRAFWTRNGNVVTVQFYLIWTAKSSPMGTVTVTGALPYKAVARTGSFFSPVIITATDGFVLGSTRPLTAGRVTDNTSVITLLKFASDTDQSLQTLDGTELANSGTFYGTITYLTADVF